MKDKFIKAYTENITRPGADKLLAWIESSDFFTAPASTRFHLSSPGGLLEHSLHVFERMNDGWREDEFVAWFHTWGSTFEEFDNGAVPVTTGIVEDEHGKVWSTAAENIRFID